MLSDRERARLLEIQRRFMVEDPQFARVFRTEPLSEKPTLQEPRPDLDVDLDLHTMWIIGAVTLSVLMLLAGWMLGALAFALGAGLLSVARRRTDDRTRLR